ncbi:MAG TPA: MFS transporter [Stellaceae bacterium]|nr:MFS transporter [Stellaceae bacterium]
MAPHGQVRSEGATLDGPESRYAWRRLFLSLLLSTIGGIGLWSNVVVLPALQADFGVARGSATLPYTLTMIGFAFGGIWMGRLADRRGVVFPVSVGAIALSIGYIASAQATNLWQFAIVQGAVVGLLGSSATFGPLVADISHWFTRNRGIAVAICASGNYLSGTVWPPILQHLVANYGWRETHIGIGIFCAVTMLPMGLLLRRPTPIAAAPAHPLAPSTEAGVPISPNALQALLVVAGLACCVAMSMPQVHIVAYCADLGYGVARGAEMLSLMLGLGVVSRLASGWISDHIGGVRTLLVGSALQCLTLIFYVPFDGLASLYVVSALFGLAQGGIVPSYAMIVREYFPAREAGTRVGLVLMATVIGMALGGWMSGAIFDWTGSYRAAFINGVLWNLLNLSIALWLLRQPRGHAAHA